MTVTAHPIPIAVRSWVGALGTAAWLLGCVTTTAPEGGEPLPVDPDRSTVAVTPLRLVANGTQQAVVSVQLRRTDGSPAAGLFIELAATGSGNLIGNPAEGTNDNGESSAVLSSRVAERKTISVSVGQPPDRVVLTQKPMVEFISASESVVALRFVVEPSNTLTGEDMSPPVQVELLDAQGLRVTQGERSVTLSLGGTSTPADLRGTTSVTSIQGVAEFSDLVLSRAGTGLFLVASAPDLPPVQSADFSVGQSAAQRLEFGVQPSGSLAGIALAPAVAVTLRGPGGPLTTNGVPITLTLKAHPSGAQLAGATSVLTTDGQAIFPNVNVPLPGSGFVLQAAAPGFQTVSSAAFDVAASTGSRVAFLAEPSSTMAGATIQPAVRVAITDAAGAILNVVTAPVTLTLSGAPLLGTTTRLAASGVATFDDLILHQAHAQVRLTATVDGVGGVQSAPFTVSAAAAASYLVSADASVVAGTPLTVTVRALDSFGNTATDHTGTVVFTSSDPRAEFAAVTSVFTEGVAVFPDAVTLKTTGMQEVAAVDMGAPSINGDAVIDVRAGALSGLRFTQQPSTAEVRTTLPEVQVSAVDAFGNPVGVGTQHVTLALASNAGLLGVVEADAVAGVAAFQALSIDQEAPDHVLIAEAPGLDEVRSDPFIITDTTAPSPAANLLITGQTRDSLTYSLTSPGDDGMLGRAAQYEARVSLIAITEETFANATFVFVGTASAPGVTVGGNVAGLDAGTTYHLGIRFTDGAGNASLSVVSGATSACAAGYAGADCSQCATGFHRTANNTCVDACTDPNPCITPPTSTCAGNQATQYAVPGVCSVTTGAPYFGCAYPPQSVNCAMTSHICVGGACIADPCAGFTCTPTPPSCEPDQLTLTVPVSTCVPQGPGMRQCVPSMTLVDCAASARVCLLGSCVVARAAGAQDLLITELMHRPPATPPGKWLEVLNVSGALLNLAGLRLEDDATSQSFTVLSSPPLLLPAGEHLVFGSTAVADVQWGGFPLGTTGSLRLSMGAETVDTLVYDTSFPQTAGSAMQLSSAATEARAHLQPWYWCDAGAGTPGAANGTCGIAGTGAVDWCNTQFPPTFNTVAAGSSALVYGRFYKPQLTTRNAAGNDLYPHVEAQLGLGSDAVNPASWTWAPADFNLGYQDLDPLTDNDEMFGSLVFTVGSRFYGYRFRLLDPTTSAPGPWTYCDLTGPTVPPAGSYGSVTVAQPVVSSVSHAYLPRGSAFSIAGSGFSVVTRVLIGGVVQPFTFVTDSELRVASLEATTPLGVTSLVLETTGTPANPFSVQVIALSLNAPVIAHGARLVITGLDGVTSSSVGGVTHLSSTTPNTASVQVLDSVPVGIQPVSVTAAEGTSAPLPVTVIHLVINELDAATPSTDVAEFVEVATGVPGVELVGYSVVFFNGAGDLAYRVIPLTGQANANGLLLLGNPGFAPDISFPNETLQNGPDAVAIFQASQVTLANGVPVTSVGLIDAVEYGTTSTADPELTLVLMGSGPEAAHAVDADTVSLKRCGTARRDGRVYSAGTASPGTPNTCP